MTEETMRAFTRALFAQAHADDPPALRPPDGETTPERGNVAPREGTGTTPGDSTGGNLHAFTRRLFGREDW